LELCPTTLNKIDWCDLFLSSFQQTKQH